MGVEPTLDQEAGRATVLKTAYWVIVPVLQCSAVSQQVESRAPDSMSSALLALSCTPFGVKSGVKTFNLSALYC